MFIWRSITLAEQWRNQGGSWMRVSRMVLAIGLICAPLGAAQAATVVIYVEPMTLTRYTKVIDTPGPDRVFVCMAPPATGGCTDVTPRKKR